MKICPACGSRFKDTGWQCPSCHTTPRLVSGFLSFAPESAKVNDGFTAAHFDELVLIEANNFWFRSRNRLVMWALKEYFSDVKSLFEVGCGTGFVLSEIEQVFPELQLFGSEIYSAGLKYAKNRLSRCGLFQMDARALPFENEFDVICAFDVLEHIPEDESVLAQMYRAVHSGGGIIITVPQHAFLWSRADEYACHVRRYSANELKLKVQKAGFTVTRITSFVSLLFPLMLVSRLIHCVPHKEHDPLAELKVGGLTNKLLEKVLVLERILIRAGLSFPFGGSLLLVAYKNS